MSQVGHDTSSKFKIKKRRRGNTETTNSSSWPVCFQRNDRNKAGNVHEGELVIVQREKRILAKKTFNYFQSVHKFIPIQHVHSLFKVFL